jgi:subtilisin family serine protease
MGPVRAYIIDTGIRTTHNEFGGRATFGANYANGQDEDCNGHGTHVAGTVGGSRYGVAKGVTLIAVKVLNCAGSGTTTGVINGINYVAGVQIYPAVANMSLGGGASQSLDDAVNKAVFLGVTFAVAAGNSGANACNYSPARAANAITVGATTSTDARASYSNYGGCVDIFAPGSSITSAWKNSNTATKTISGTSMASPHVAGVAVLYLEANPGATAGAVSTALINGATDKKVTNAGSGSPTKLLYSLFQF